MVGITALVDYNAIHSLHKNNYGGMGILSPKERG